MRVLVDVTDEVGHGHAADALRLRDRAVLVSKEHCLEVDDFFAHLSNLRRQSIVFCAEELNLGLQIGKPLLLPLATLQGSNPTTC